MANSSSNSRDPSSTQNEAEVVEEPPKSWVGYSWYLVKKVAIGTWAGIHVFGEKLAWGLGITSPDWQYALDIHEDLLREEQEEKEEEEKALKRQEELVAQRLLAMENASTDQDRTNINT